MELIDGEMNEWVSGWEGDRQMNEKKNKWMSK